MTLFNRSLHRKHREKAAGHFAQVDFLKTEICERMVDRLLDISRSFPLAVDLGCHTGQLRKALPTGKIGQLIHTDFAATMGAEIQCDEECLPFSTHSLDAVFSAFSLHWVNDLPGTLIQIRRALKPDGLFMAAMPGPHSLQELRESCLKVAAADGKASPRIAPFVEVRDAGALLQRAGFALPVIDSESIQLTYRDFPTLLRELKMMGESNALSQQFKGLTTARYWQAVEAAYPRNAEGLYPLTVELIFITAWSPDASQQQPAKRGSGTVSLKDIL